MDNDSASISEPDRARLLTLRLLDRISRDGEASQRHLARDLNVALGLANVYLRRCVRKGLVKVRQVPRRRYIYYLTPRGFTEKARLTADYFTSSLQVFRRARARFAAGFESGRARGWRRFALAGDGDLAEIALLTARECGVEIVGLVSRSGVKNRFGLPVAASLAELPAVDAVLLVDPPVGGGARAAHVDMDALLAALPPERIINPGLLGFVTTPPPARPRAGRAP